MAIKTIYMGSGQDGNYGALFDGAAQTAASRTDGWTVGKIGTLLAADFDAATKQATGAMVTNTTRPSALITSATANAFKTPAALSGAFANTAWTFTFAVRAVVLSAQAGRIRMRVYRSVNADGTGATELTSATQVGTTSSVLSTSADVTTVVTWSPGATINLANEYLFFTLAWEITTAGGSNTADVVLRTGSTGPAGSRLVTPDFVATQTLPIGRRVAATTIRGVTLAPIPGAVPVGVGKVVGPAYSGSVAFWKLDESPASNATVIADTSGGGHTGSLLTGEGATNKSVAGHVGTATAIRFDGVDDYISITTKPGEGIGASDFSVGGWIRDTSDQTTPRAIIGRDDEQPGGRQFLLSLHASTAHVLAGILVGSIFASDTSYIQVETAAGTVTPNVWHQVVFRRQAGVLSLWLDGVSMALTTNAYGGATAGLTIQNTNAECNIAARSYVGSRLFFAGDLDQLALYSRALSDVEIQSSYNYPGMAATGAVVRGVTVGLPLQLLPVGRRATATTVSGVTVVPAPAVVPIGSVGGTGAAVANATVLQSKATSGKSGTSLDIQWNNNCTLGSTVFAVCYWNSATATCSVADPNNGTWTPIGAPQVGAGALSGYRVQMFARFGNVTAAKPLVLGTISPSITDGGICLVELSGGRTVIENSVYATSAAANPTQSLTPNVAGDAMVAFEFCESTAGSSAGSGWTILESASFAGNPVAVRLAVTPGSANTAAWVSPTQQTILGTAVVGNPASNTVVRGVTPAAVGAVPIPVGARAAATAARGVTLAATGAVPLLVGARAAATAVRGVGLVTVVAFPVPGYTSRWDPASTGSLTIAGGFIHKINDIGSPVNDMVGSPDPEYGARSMNQILVPDYGGVAPGVMQAPLATNQTVKTVFIVAQADSTGGVRPLFGGDQVGGFEIRVVDGAVQLVRNGVTTIVAHPTPIIPGVPFIVSVVVDG